MKLKGLFLNMQPPSPTSSTRLTNPGHIWENCWQEIKKLIIVLHSNKFLNLKAYKKQLRSKSEQIATFFTVIESTKCTNNLGPQACLLARRILSQSRGHTALKQCHWVGTCTARPGEKPGRTVSLQSLGKSFSGPQHPHLRNGDTNTLCRTVRLRWANLLRIKEPGSQQGLSARYYLSSPQTPGDNTFSLLRRREDLGRWKVATPLVFCLIECIHFLVLIHIKYYKLAAPNNRNSFSPSSWGQKYEIRVLAGLCSLWDSR